MNENKNLLPCPFCGGEAKIMGFLLKKHLFGKSHYTNDIPNADGYLVKCTFCECSTTASVDKESVITAWNRRTCSCKKQEV